MPTTSQLEERIAYLESIVANLPSRFPAMPQVPRPRKLVQLQDHLYYGITSPVYGTVCTHNAGGGVPDPVTPSQTIQILPGFTAGGFNFDGDYIEVELQPNGWTRIFPGTYRAEGTLGSSLTVGSSVSVTVRGGLSITVYGWLGDVGNGKKIVALWDDYNHRWTADGASC